MQVKGKDKTALNIPEVAELLSVPLDTAENLLYSEGFPVFRIGDTAVVTPKALKAWVKAQEKGCREKSLKYFDTCELVEELSKREGVFRRDIFTSAIK